MKPACDLVFGGGGSLLPMLLGAGYAVERHRDVRRACGSSAGAIAAAAVAFSIPAKVAHHFCIEFLHGDRLLDPSLWPLDRWGIYSGDVLHRALKETFPGKMGDASLPLSIVVSDLWTRRPLVITSSSHPNVPVADALRASCSIPVLFKSFRLNGQWGSRLFVDGGIAMNFAMDHFDDSSRPTIGIRVRREGHGEPSPVRGLVAFAAAIAELFMYASDNAYLSAKHTRQTIDIPTLCDGLDFDLNRQAVIDRWLIGETVATKAMGAL